MRYVIKYLDLAVNTCNLSESVFDIVKKAQLKIGTVSLCEEDLLHGQVPWWSWRILLQNRWIESVWL